MADLKLATEFKNLYSLFLNSNKDIQHYASHSHHYWPDVTKQAMIDYWEDSCRLVDNKWDYFFSQKLPLAQNLIAEVLNLPNSNCLVFAANTHELVYRLFSCFFDKEKVKVLTTDSEFHSFERQSQRLSEDSVFVFDRISTNDFSTFESRFIQQIENEEYDIIFFSQVFFNSGYAITNLNKIVKSIKSEKTMIVVDGYHAFMALPVDLSGLSERLFYIAGSYKYAQGGEGCCWMSVPTKWAFNLRPQYTGWFAGFSELTQKTKQVSYALDGFKFAGATMDFSAMYRLISVLQLFKKNQISVEIIHRHVQQLQRRFIERIQQSSNSFLSKKNLLLYDLNQHGHFLTFELKKIENAKNTYQQLKDLKIMTDYRGSRLRFGFGLYQNEDVDFKGFL